MFVSYYVRVNVVYSNCINFGLKSKILFVNRDSYNSDKYSNIGY